MRAPSFQQYQKFISVAEAAKRAFYESGLHGRKQTQSLESLAKNLKRDGIVIEKYRDWFLQKLKSGHDIGDLKEPNSVNCDQFFSELSSLIYALNDLVCNPYEVSQRVEELAEVGVLKTECYTQHKQLLRQWNSTRDSVDRICRKSQQELLSHCYVPSHPLVENINITDISKFPDSQQVLEEWDSLIKESFEEIKSSRLRTFFLEAATVSDLQKQISRIAIILGCILLVSIGLLISGNPVGFILTLLIFLSGALFCAVDVSQWKRNRKSDVLLSSLDALFSPLRDIDLQVAASQRAIHSEILAIAETKIVMIGNSISSFERLSESLMLELQLLRDDDEIRDVISSFNRELLIDLFANTSPDLIEYSQAQIEQQRELKYLYIGSLVSGGPAEWPIEANDFPIYLKPAIASCEGDSNLSNLVIRSTNASSREAAISSLKSLAIRAMSFSRARSLQCIFIDPISVGSSFPFKGIPDFLTGPKTYTRPDEISQQLNTILSSLEQIIQQYLGTDFQDLQEFNKAKPFAAEPLRYIFITDFPSNFSKQAIETLISILENGCRTGISVLMHMSHDAEWPRGMQLQQIEQYCTVISSTNKEVDMRPIFSHYLTQDCEVEIFLEESPSIEKLSKIIGKISDNFCRSKTETVPFSELYPSQPDLWNLDGRQELRTPIGIMGAMDTLDFWLGTNENDIVASQALLAGKPGAGKSYTLHAIINSLALRYAPDELELYLLDYKEGVEFQIYVDPTRSQITDFNADLDDSQALPHAKVVSIESDREFGLSVLQHVQYQIEQRGEAFKKAGVSKLSEYRDRTGEKMPRILVVIDEFQYMFQENDNITKELNLILEDIARRGRAFGVHMLLASQSPRVTNISSSIYSFIELRMAQQMDQRTAGAILDESNIDAVELLDRPGRIIYNRDFGRKAYNELGQVADASEAARREALLKIQDIAQEKQYTRPEPLVVFNGSKPTKLAHNRQLAKLTNQPDWLSPRQLNKEILQLEDWDLEDVPGVAWLGEAMRIGNHSQAIFRRRPRSNMLLVGNSEESIYGILSGMLISLIHSYQPHQASFSFIDLAPSDEEKPWTDFSLMFRDSFSDHFPIEIAKRRKNEELNIQRAETLFGNVWTEFQRRKDIRDADPDAYEFGPSHFFIYSIGSLNRTSNLRPVMGKRKEETSEDAQKLQQLLTEGPELGIHTILWLDNLKGIISLTADSLKPWLAHFDLRTVLSMSTDDSSKLIGETWAQKLPPVRAYFKDYGVVDSPEKFKPYAVPTPDVIQQYENNFQTRE